MVRQLASRSQRRMEKKQAVILLMLVLVVSLVSFALGVMVGRSSIRTPVAVVPPPPVRLPVAEALPSPVPAAATPGAQPADSLTFYDSLPKGGEAPLGSGINLPPAREATPVAATAARPEPAKPAAAVTAPTVVASAPSNADASASRPEKVVALVTNAAPAVAGGYLVQAAAFRRSEDAKGLQAKLARKGYVVFTEEAQLGEKGVWYRVYVGPFGTSGAADAAVSRLKAEEKLTALIRKR